MKKECFSLGRWVVAITILFMLSTRVFAFDHAHQRWEALLQKHVIVSGDGHASRVDYVGFKQDQDALEQYLGGLTAVSQSEFNGFSKEQQMAFLINAYNAFTIKLILSAYPNLKSIKDLGSLLRSPWKKPFFTLLGEEHNLDWIEHENLRKEGVYDEPRVHFAVNCASVGCPKLSNHAWQASQLDDQLARSMQEFLQDRTRNYYDAAEKKVYLSKIFDWFEKDFVRKFGSMDAFISKQADALGIPAGERGGAGYTIRYTDYDWTLNDSRNAATESGPSHRSR